MLRTGEKGFGIIMIVDIYNKRFIDNFLLIIRPVCPHIEKSWTLFDNQEKKI